MTTKAEASTSARAGDDGGLAASHPVEVVAVASLRPHPRNYRDHPEEQITHLMASIREHGIYRNIVIARDGTILAGHGVVKAIQKMKWETVPVVRLDIAPDDARALRLVAGDNEIWRLAEINDRALTELLKEVRTLDDVGLLGTGFDDQMLSALVMVTRGRDEIADFDAASEWVGMPEYDQGSPDVTQVLVIRFRTEADREAFIAKAGLDHEFIKQKGNTCSTEWPQEPRHDLINVRIEES